MNLERVRPRTAAGRILTAIACWSVPGVVGALCSLRGWSTGWLLFAGLPLAAGLSALLLAEREEEGSRYFTRSRWWAADLFGQVAFFATIAAVIVFGYAMLEGARLIVLDLRGEPAVVRMDGESISASERRGRYDEDFCYRMSRLDGTPVSGEICREGREFYLNRPTDVVIDPSGFSGPETPEAVAGVALPRTVAVASFGVLCVLAVVSGWGPTRERPAPSRPAKAPVDRSRVVSPRRGKPRSPRRRGHGRQPGAGRRR